MEGKKDLLKGNIISFSQDKNILNTPHHNYFFGQFMINSNKNKTSFSNYNISIYNRLQNINNNNYINNSNRLNLRDSVTNKFFLKSNSKDNPIKIRKEITYDDKFLPLLQNDKKNESTFSSKENMLKTKKDVKKIKYPKFSTNKSFFSVDKLKMKKKINKKHKKNNDKKKDEQQKYINTLNKKINKRNISEKCEPVFSSKNITKKRGHSSYHENNTKKKKLILKNKEKNNVNNSALDIVDTVDELKNDLIMKEENMNNNEILKLKNLMSRNNIYNFSIDQYNPINKNEINIGMNLNYNNNYSNAEDIENSTYNKSLLISQNLKKQTQIYFYVFHFFKSNNIYFYIPNSKYEQVKNKLNNINSKNIKKNYEIIEDFYLPQAFRPRMNKWPNMPECITDTCKNGGIALIRNFDNCNLIWKLIHPNKMKNLMRSIHNNQKYNHFISTFHLGRKDNLYKHFKYYKRLFPEMYNYAPATYILPNDSPDFEIEYKKNKKTLWIVKPVNLSRGRGIHLLKGESEYKSLYKKSTQLSLPQYLISRYIDKPHLLNNKKYDLRIYVLVVSFAPLRIYLYNNGLVRFATEDYKRGDLDNVFIHLTNYSINKNNLKYKSNQNLKNQQCELFPREETEGTEAEGGLEGEILDGEIPEGEENYNGDENTPDDDSNKWSLIEYRNYFKKNGKGNIMDMIWNQIEAIVIKTIISVSTEFYKNIYPSKLNNAFELYGFDILIDEKFRAWLIEVNVNPSLHCTSPLDLSIKTDLISDIFNVVGILPYNHNGNKSVYNYTMINQKKEEKNNSSTNYFNFNNKNKNSYNKSKILSKSLKIDREDFVNKMSIKSNILRNFDSENLEKKIPEYDDEYYKKMIEIFNEEKSRANTTEFNLIFPLKNNIKTYGKILIKDNAINDYNIVLWQNILTNE